MICLTDGEFVAISSYFKSCYGVNLTSKKPLIEGRLGNYIEQLGYKNYTDYFEFAKTDSTGNEISVLINKLTTNHTYFMREVEHFQFFKDRILPWVDKDLSSKDLRVWSAGCSSGQEPYTLAMIAKDYLGSSASSWDYSLLASDISEKALIAAKLGIYPKLELEEMPKAWLNEYFTILDENSYVISEKIKGQVSFRNFNLLSPFNFKKPFHAIFCRNVMIYFDIPTKNEIIDKFYDALLPGGYFIISLSESLSSCTHKFKYVMPSVYQK
ncbi:MAG: protein-glutamate O-methyltransferase CheR [Eubacteriales bacterium]